LDQKITHTHTHALLSRNNSLLASFISLTAARTHTEHNTKDCEEEEAAQERTAPGGVFLDYFINEQDRNFTLLKICLCPFFRLVLDLDHKKLDFPPSPCLFLSAPRASLNAFELMF